MEGGGGIFLVYRENAAVHTGVWKFKGTHHPRTYLKGILCDFFILTLEQIIVLNKYCTYNKPIPKISQAKTLQNLCKMRYK